MISMSSREFNQDIGQAKRKSTHHPIVITERGKPTHVLLSFDDYQQMVTAQPKVTELLKCADETDFEPAKLELHVKPVDFD